MSDEQPQPTRAARTRAAARERREQEKRELRQAILDTAGKLFAEQGYDRFSLRQVAEQIGYSPATIYLYFKDKDDLLFTVVDEGFRRFGEALKAASDSATNHWERIVTIGQAYVRFGLAYPVHYHLMFIQRSDFLLDCPPEEHQPRINSFNVLQDAVAGAMAAGELRGSDVRLVSGTLWALVHGIVALAISMPFITDEEATRMNDLAGEMIQRGLAI
ncbi:MAG TPA: TetR/AcrR family transcriptional regulator [Herpetosiphonaceae bacterium]